MDANDAAAYNLIDISIKRLVRANPAAFLELAGFTVAPDRITFEDTAIQQRERRADHICIITADNGARRGVVYLEYQLVPDPDIVTDWLWKWIGLVQRFPVPVVLLVVYLHRGNYATFHQDYRARLGGLETAVQFNTFRFWECAAQIRGGNYPDFVPLLSLCEEHPTEATVREQVALIQHAALDEHRKQELISLSFIVASRDIAREILLRVIREVFIMKTLPPIVEDMFGDALRERERQRIQEAEKLAEARGEERGEKRGEERGEKRGEERGEKRGEVIGARAALLHLYTKKFGVAPAEVVARLEAIDTVAELYSMIDRYGEEIVSWPQLVPPSTD
jgi:predicted transposase YdaD